MADIIVIDDDDRVAEQEGQLIPVCECGLAITDLVGKYLRVPPCFEWPTRPTKEWLHIAGVRVMCLRFHLHNCGMYDGTDKPCGIKRPV